MTRSKRVKGTLSDLGKTANTRHLRRMINYLVDNEVVYAKKFKELGITTTAIADGIKFLVNISFLRRATPEESYKYKKHNATKYYITTELFYLCNHQFYININERGSEKQNES